MEKARHELPNTIKAAKSIADLLERSGYAEQAKRVVSVVDYLNSIQALLDTTHTLYGTGRLTVGPRVPTTRFTVND